MRFNCARLIVTVLARTYITTLTAVTQDAFQY